MMAFTFKDPSLQYTFNWRRISLWFYKRFFAAPTYVIMGSFLWVIGALQKYFDGRWGYHKIKWYKIKSYHLHNICIKAVTTYSNSMYVCWWLRYCIWWYQQLITFIHLFVNGIHNKPYYFSSIVVSITNAFLCNSFAFRQLHHNDV